MKIACILLAAGRSSRMKGKNKLLLKIGAETFIHKVGKVLNSLELSETVVVSSESSDLVFSELKEFSFQHERVNDPDKGMHASIRKGVERLRPGVDAFFICFGDQPFLTRDVFQKLIHAFPAGRKDQIIYGKVGEERKQPVLIGSDFIPEILAHQDGDFGCSYLLQNHPDSCIAVDFNDSRPFDDIDTPDDFRNIEKDPTEAFHELCLKLGEDRKPYVIATVIEIFGSASARTGSKAIFDEAGTNLLGWVGGGCAEQHVGQQSTEALKEKRTRIIEADLDDEIYGLGVACGGKMNLFLEPVLPAETVTLETHYPDEAVLLGKRYGWHVEAKAKASSKVGSTLRELPMDLVHAIAAKRNKSGTSLRELKDLPVHFHSESTLSRSSRVTLVGSTRITEALTSHFELFGFTVRVVGPLLKKYGEEDGPEITFEPGERVIVASHTSQDPYLVSQILKQDVSYLAMVGSRKRALDVLKKLQITEGSEILKPLYVPAGFDIDAKNPEEVALSIVAECLTVTS